MENNYRKVGDIRITDRQAAVLKFMADALREDWVWLALDKVHGKTIKTLLSHGWITDNAGADGVRYRITLNGRRALRLYQLPKESRRRDGICPRCGERSKRMRRSGKLAPYCTICERASSARKYALKINNSRKDRLCSRCKKRRVLTRPSGRTLSYCRQCSNLLKRRGKKRWNAQKMKRIQSGEVLLCTRPGCTRPRHVTTNTVNDLCLEHYREWHNAYRQRKRAVTPARKAGRPRKEQAIEKEG